MSKQAQKNCDKERRKIYPIFRSYPVAVGAVGGVCVFPLLLPALLLALGVSWFVAAWGVFIMDMTQIEPMFVQMLMFLSPVAEMDAIIDEIEAGQKS